MYWTMCSPSRCGNRWGNTSGEEGGEEEEEREEKEEEEASFLLGFAHMCARLGL